MHVTKIRALAILFVIVFLVALWFAIPSRVPIPSPDAAAPESAPIPESIKDTPITARSPEVSQIPEEVIRPKPIARKYNQSTRKERLAADRRSLKSVHAGGWKESAFWVARYGDPDEATEAILDLVQNRDDLTAESAKILKDYSEPKIAQLQAATYTVRLAVLASLGLTRTKRAEEFLLNAYKNPHDLIPYKKYLQLADEQRALGYDTFSHYTFLDAITRKNTLTGLLLLDEPKYSPMLEEDYYRLVPDAERIYRKENPRETDEDFILLGRWGTLLDALVIRDMIRERGTENPFYLLEYAEFQGDWSRFTARYWNHQTNTAVPRQ